MSGKKRQVDQPYVSAVARTFEILEAVAEHDQIGLAELSRMLHIHKSTVYRFLTTMCDLGYVRRVPNTQDYTMTIKVFQLGSAVVERIDIVQQSRPIMEELAEATHETIHLATRDSDSLVYLDKIDSRHTLRMYSRVGKNAPLYCTGLGKALIAWLPDEQVNRILGQGPLHKYTGTTITELPKLLSDLKATRSRGYAVDEEEHETGIRCVAAPIFDRSGEPCAALSVSWPSPRVDVTTAGEWALHVRRAAIEVSNAIGGVIPEREP